MAQVCVLTPPGRGAIAVVAVVGEGVRARVEALMKRSLAEPGRVYYGQLADEVLAHWTPRGFTGLETVEVSCHGGAGAVRAVLEALALPEIGWDAYVGLAAHLDEIQKEAWRLLPYAATTLAAMVLMDQAQGALSRALAEGRDVPMWGRALVRPRRVVLTGRPNAGKSTTFNALVQAERALVYDEPGTTRDPVEELIAIEGVPLWLVDTAGVETPRDDIERQAIERARREIARADLVVVVQEPSMKRYAFDGPHVEFVNRRDDVESLRRAILERLGIRPRYVPGGAVEFRDV